jgi:putative hemolysin
VETVLEPVIFVDEDEMMDDVFDKLKIHSTHLAVVTDRKKNVKGIVTMEDLLEEIVGEIYDESDRKRVRLQHIDNKTAIVRGDMLITELQEKIGIPVKAKFATISDLISSRFDGKPKKGQQIKLKNFTLTILDVDKQNPSLVKRVKVVKRRGKIVKK